MNSLCRGQAHSAPKQIRCLRGSDTRCFSLLANWLMALLAFSLVGASAAADVYPSRPIKLIAPYSAGGPGDTSGRLMAEALGRQLNQAVVVENRTGAGGVIGTEAVLHSEPDGYTLLVSAAATFTVIPAGKKVAYDPEKDFVPLGQTWYAAQALVVNPKSDFKTVADLIAYAKANPDKVSFGSAGNGTTTHLSMGMLSQEAGVRLVHIPYRSTSQSVVHVLGGQINAIFGDISTVAPQVKAGMLTALAVTGAERSPLLPNVPTTAEVGLPGIKTVNWFGIHAPAKTPPAILDRLKAAVKAAQLDPTYKAALTKLSNSTGTVGAEAFAEMIHQEIQRLYPVVRSMGIRFD